jgi:hypothetical protein
MTIGSPCSRPAVVSLILAPGNADKFDMALRRASDARPKEPGRSLLRALFLMPHEPTYSLFVVRPDGTREPIATGIPEERASMLRQFLDVKTLLSRLSIEREQSNAA